MQKIALNTKGSCTGSSPASPFRERSVSDIAGVQTARNGRIRCAFDNRPAIGKQGQFERIFLEPQHDTVLANLAVSSEALAHLGEIDWPGMFVDLD